MIVLLKEKPCSYPGKRRDCGPDGVFAVRFRAAIELPDHEYLTRLQGRLLNDVQKKAKARTSMLWRAGAFGGVAGSLNDVCGVNRARPSVWES